MNKQRKEIKSIIEPQLSSDGGGVQWFRTITPANAVDTMPFSALEYFRLGETQIESPNPKPRELNDTLFFLYMLHGKFLLRIDSKMIKEVNAGELLTLHTGKSTILEEVLIPTHGKLEGFRLWLNQTIISPSEKSVKITPKHSKNSSKNASVQIQVFTGRTHFDGLKGENNNPPVNLLRIDVDKSSEFRWVAPQHHNVLGFVFQGRGYFGPYRDEKEVLIARHQVLIFGQGDEIVIRTEDTPISLLIATGQTTP